MATTELIQEGKEFMSKLRFADAEDRFQQALNSDPRSLEAKIWLGRLALMRNRKEAGLKLLDEALAQSPGNAEALALKGVSRMQDEDYQGALEFLEKARSSDPNLKMIYYNLARSYRELERWKEAESGARKAIELDPRDFQSYSELSYIYGKTDRLKEAIDAMVKAIEINPLFLKGYLVLGALYTRGGKGELAIELYKEGLRHNPNAHPLREHLAELYAVKLDYRSAYEHAVELITRRQEYKDFLRVGNFAVALGMFEKAEKAYKKSIEINPSSWEGHYNLGELYMSAKLMKEAKEQYQAAVEKDGKSYKPYNGMGLFILHTENNAEEAKKYLIRALELAPTRPEPVLNMALACSVLKDWASAEKFAAAATKLSRAGDGIYEQAVRLQEAIQAERQKLN